MNTHTHTNIRDHASCQRGHTVTSPDMHGFISGRPGSCAAAAKTSQIPVKTFTSATAAACDFSQGVISRMDEGKSAAMHHPRGNIAGEKENIQTCVCCALLAGRLRGGPAAAADRTSFDAPSFARRYFSLVSRPFFRLPRRRYTSRHQRGGHFS